MPDAMFGSTPSNSAPASLWATAGTLTSLAALGLDEQGGYDAIPCG